MATVSKEAVVFLWDAPEQQLASVFSLPMGNDKWWRNAKGNSTNNLTKDVPFLIPELGIIF